MGQQTKHTPSAADYGMVEIGRRAFSATVCKLDVHPTPTGSYDRVTGYLSNWKLRDGRIVGKTVGGTVHSHTAYMVSPEFMAANRSAIAAAQGAAA